MIPALLSRQQNRHDLREISRAGEESRKENTPAEAGVFYVLICGVTGSDVQNRHVDHQATMSLVSRAMTSSSLVGMTKTLTLESGVEIMMSSPRLELATGSISTPR